jgi:hypothetical protein
MGGRAKESLFGALLGVFAGAVVGLVAGAILPKVNACLVAGALVGATSTGFTGS